ncbi:transposase [Streptomyces sp. NPDC090442]|uniref:transposase n=1 Tax=Streptomyces sp. NPDC090442 TaxID=3365962 RepID=UPI003806D198
MPYQSIITELAEASSATLACDCYVHQFGAIAVGRRVSLYPTDMTDAEWARVRASMPVPAWLEGQGGRPEEHCHREMIDAVRYLVDNGVK